MRYQLWFEGKQQWLIRQRKFLSEILKVKPYQDGLMTGFVEGELRGELSEFVVFGEIKRWKNKAGEERTFVRIDNHRSGRYILTPYKLEEVLERGSMTIDERTDFKRVELKDGSIREIFNTYKGNLASLDTRPFVLALADKNRKIR